MQTAAALSLRTTGGRIRRTCEPLLRGAVFQTCSIAINNVVLLRYNHTIGIIFKIILRRNEAIIPIELDHIMQYNFSRINVEKFVKK